MPGALAGWLHAQEKYGRLTPAESFADAIRLAEEGAPVSYRNHEFITMAADHIRGNAAAAGTFLVDDAAPRPGGLLKQPNLARSMRRVVEGGRDAFYRGDLGREFVAAVQAAGGILTTDDLANFTVREKQPLSIDVFGCTVFSPPPPCSGFQYLQTLGMLADEDLVGMGHNSADYLHLLLEAIKLATADRIHATMVDEIDHTTLLERDYLRERRSQINPTNAALGLGERFDEPATHDSAAVQPGARATITRRNGEHTTHFAVVDADGMAVNVTQSLGNPFGAGVMAGETGLMLNNFLNWIDLDPASPNALQPGRQMENCMSPPQVYRDGRFLMTMGTPGSWGILQTQAQALLNVLAFGMHVQDAIEAPRVRLTSGRTVMIEGRVPAEVRADLAQRGHDVETLPDFTWAVGGMHGIMRDPETHVLIGGADPRRDGAAVGW